MLYVVTCQDRPGMTATRMEHRPAHLEWATAQGSPIKMAGPLLDDQGSPLGSLLVVEADGPDALEAFLRTDPYAQAELFAHVTFAPFRWTVNPPEGLNP
jgi:uncharacterized protein